VTHLLRVAEPANEQEHLFAFARCIPSYVGRAPDIPSIQCRLCRSALDRTATNHLRAKENGFDATRHSAASASRGDILRIRLAAHSAAAIAEPNTTMITAANVSGSAGRTSKRSVLSAW
jgi:hypothetical protein